jgi:L-malate glycosyltransferase
MNILWISNIPFGKLLDLAGIIGENTSGSWLNAALSGFVGDSKYNLTVVTVGRVKSIRSIVENNITYCLLPGGYPSEYNYKKKSNEKYWQNIKEKYKPDIVHVWGTEFTHGYLAIKLMLDIPSVIYAQGLLESISRYYLAGITKSELIKSITIRDLIKFNWITRQQKDYFKRSYIEAEMIRSSGNVIVENAWCSSHCLDIIYSCKIYKCALSIRNEFFELKWVKEKIDPFTIMCNAAGYPVKGLHILIKALNRVVKKYPTTKLYIPGEKSPFGKSIFQKIKENGYTKFIRTLIEDLKLENNIIFMGRLSPKQMAEQMAKSNVFVMPSSIENHSSTLIEAMLVGVPCIASYVGGVPEYLKHQENGLLYRFEEHEMLAEYIKQMFDNLDVASKLGNNASAFTRSTRSSEDIKGNLISIYDSVIALRVCNK